MFNRIKRSIRHEYVDHKRLMIETIFFFLLSVLLIALFHLFEVSEAFFEFTRTHEEYELDEIVFTMAIISVVMMVYVIRRFLELKQTIIKANTDPLIGIFNRRKGSELISEEIYRAGISKIRSSIIMFDIDDFKRINDQLGHNAGDAVLIEIAKIIDAEIRENDIIIRWGGEEFIVLCVGADINDAKAIAERCRQAVSEKEFIQGEEVTVSVGVSELKSELDLRTNIELVDQRLYMSKSGGKNMTSF